MEQPRYVAAIEISSSKVIGAVGLFHPEDGHMDVLAVEQEKGIEAVRHGIIQNVEETATRVKRLIARLERNPKVAPRKIVNVFIGLSGRSMRSIPTKVSMQFNEETVITGEIVGQLRDKAFGTAIDSSLEVLDAVPHTFTIGNTRTTQPVGNLGSLIQGEYDLIVSRPRIRKNINRLDLQNNLGLRNTTFFVTQLAAGRILLSEEEKRLGCMMVDLGAETTTVTIYKDGTLQYYATLPMGSRNITRDITVQNLLEEQAEELKIQSGNALPEEAPSTLNIHGVRLSDVSKLIIARCEEIVANVIEQINYAGLTDSDLPRGIILTGGGSKLKNIDQLISKISSIENVRRASLPSYITLDSGYHSVPEMVQVLSILYAGGELSNQICLETPKREEMPATGDPNPEPVETDEKPREQRGKSRTNKFLNFIGRQVAGMFTPTDEDSDLE